jgi:hypothetical protein
LLQPSQQPFPQLSLHPESQPQAFAPPQQAPQTLSQEQSYCWNAIERPQPSPQLVTAWQPSPATQQQASAAATLNRLTIQKSPLKAQHGAPDVAIDGTVSGSAENR